MNDSGKPVGVPLENYMPELELAIKTSAKLKEEAKVKRHICEKQGVHYIWVPLKKNDSLAGFAQRVKMALQKVHVYISTGDEEDVELLRYLFEDWRRKAEIT